MKCDKEKANHNTKIYSGSAPKPSLHPLFHEPEPVLGNLLTDLLIGEDQTGIPPLGRNRNLYTIFFTG